jgi:methylenetetrahydrofolate reductase (NADPH)
METPGQARTDRGGIGGTPAKPPFRIQLAAPRPFVTVAELAPWRGTIDFDTGKSSLSAALGLVGDPRIAAISVTDNAGGHVKLSPQTLAEEFLRRGQDVIIHVACRDRSRNALLSLGLELASLGVNNVLALSGDYPVEGYAGLSRAVFDIDSVGLLAMYSSLNRELMSGASQTADRESAAPVDQEPLFLGAVVNNHKVLEAEVMTQYYKLALKVRSGARYVIEQVGYDARKGDELLHWMRLRGLDVPVIANVYVLSRAVARMFHEGRMPGCTVTDALLEVAQREASSPDKGRAFFLEFAAKQVAIARGLGYAGAYIGGRLKAADYDRILSLADSFAPDDWRAFAREISYAQPGEFHYFEEDRETSLASDRVNRRYRQSLRASARRRASLRASPEYRLSRLAHRYVFKPGVAGFRAGTALYRRVDGSPLDRPLHALEQAFKIPFYGCRDCGDCSLPDIAYLCPESQCAKNQRNGPCGGSHKGTCEVLELQCIWVRAYERLKAWGEEEHMLDRSPVIQDNALRCTSAWANTFLGRDHFARHDTEE